METLAPIVIVDSGVGRFSLMMVVVNRGGGGWSRWRRSLSLTVALAVFINSGHLRRRQQWDGADGANRHH